MKYNYIRIILSIALLLGNLSVSANSNYSSKVTATAVPTAAGTVYVTAPNGGTSGATEGTKSESASSAPTHKYTLTATTTDNDYTWDGWYDSNNKKQNNGSNPCEVSVTAGTSTVTKSYTARWTATFYARANSYASPTEGGGTYVSCNGNSPTQASQYIASDYSNWSQSDLTSAPECSAYFAALEKDGYEFVGWYTEANGKGTKKSAEKAYTEKFKAEATNTSSRTTINRYAYFQQLQTYYFKAQASVAVGSGTVYASFTNGSFSSSTATASERAAKLSQTQSSSAKTAYFKAVESDSKYHFAGWFTDAACTDANRVSTDLEYSVDMGKSSATSSSSPLTKTLYAKFVQELTPEINATGFTYTNPTTMKVDDVFNNAFTFLNTSEIGSGLTVTCSSNISYTNNTIKALASGDATITFKQSQDGYIKAKDFTFNFTISRVSNTLELNSTSDTKFVDQEVTNILKDASINSNAEVKTSSTDKTIAYYDVTNDKIVIPNKDAKSFKTKTVTIKIWQDENVKYAASGEKTFTLTVKKYETSFNGSAYTLDVDATQTADYTYSYTSATQPTASNNNDFYYTLDNVEYTNESFNQEGGFVTFNPANKLITAKNAGTGKITLHQKETYKFTGAEKSFNVTVNKKVPQFALDNTKPELDQQVTLSLENTDGVSVSFSPEGKVSYNASTGKITALELGTTTMTVTQPEKYNIAYKQTPYTIEVIKKTPTLKVIMGNKERTKMSATQGSTVAVSFVTDPAAEVVVTPVEGKQYASYVNGVMTAGVAGQTATYCASVAATDTYQAKSVNFSLTVTSNSKHLPITNNDGFTVGSAEGTHWEDKYEQIDFEGIPDQLSFKYAYIFTEFGDLGNPTLNYDNLSNSAKNILAVNIFDRPKNWSSERKGSGNTHMLYIEASADGVKWHSIWTDDDATSTAEKSLSEPISLPDTIRHLRFHHSCNFSNSYYKISITERKYVENPSPASINFGEAVINSNTITRETNVNWCNVAPITVTSSDSRISVSPSTFGNFEQSGSQTLTLSYTPASADETINATVTLSNDDNTYNKTINVKAATVRRTQQVTWDTDLKSTGFAMNVGEQYPDDNLLVIAESTNKGRITFTSADATKIEVIADTALLAKGIGKVKIAAHQAGDDEYQAVHDTVEFTVTALQKQSITWNQNLRGLLTTSDTVHLKARTTSGMKITYISQNTNVVKIINDTVLEVVGEGKTYVTATQSGGKDANNVEWLGVSQDNYVIVRNPNAQCEEIAVTISELTLKKGKLSVDSTLTGIPEKLTFSAKHGTKQASSWGGTSYSSLIVDQYAKINEKWDWYELFNQTVGTESANYTTYQNKEMILDETATKIRFRTLETGTDHTITNILVTRKMFVRADVDSIDAEVEADAIWSKDITITHSNIDVMSISSKKNLLSFSSETVGAGCEDFGNHSFTAAFTPSEKNTNYYDTIVITDGKAKDTHTIEIPVHLYSKGLTQVMSDFNAPATALTTDANFTLSAKTTSNLPITFVSSDTTKARIVNDNELEYVAGGTVTVYAIQAGGTKFDSVALEQTLVISKVTPVIAENERPAADNVRYNGTWANDLLTDGAARTTWHGVADTEVQGQFVWSENVDETITNIPDTYNRSVTFKPTDSGKFNEVTFTMPVNVLRAKSVIAVDNETLLARFPEQNATLDLSTLVTEQTGEGALTFDFVNSDVTTATIDEATFTATALGDYAIRATIAQTQYYTEETFDFTVSIIEGIIFDGTNAPTPTADDPVIIRTDMTIGNGVDMEVKALTIDEGYTLTIADGGKLTVGNESSLTRTEYGHIIVEAGGQLMLNGGEVKVNDFTLHAAAGDDTHAAKSGQVSNEQQIAVQGKAYFVLDIDPSGATTTGWYDFTVPFPVDALHGITRWNAETGEWMTLVNETDYAVMTYHEELRARGQYGWQKYKGIMQPGVGYSMTANTTINRYRFEMVEDGTFNSSFTKNLQASEDGLVKDKGWNIIGNGTMTYVTLDDAPRNTVQIFNHTNNAYDCISTTDHQFVVGSAYFVQADAASVLNMTSATDEDESRALRAPKRTTEQKIEATITISQPNSTDEADRLMITADEDAASEYIIGKDLLKMGTMSKSLKPRIWTAMKPAGILCAVNAPMQQNETIVPFKFYMPTEGTYTISAQDSHAENVYLLRNGVIVWNLSMSDYTLEQAQGLHTEYSIMLVKQTTDAATGVDNLDNDAESGTIFVEKMIVNGQLFILRDGILYDAQGRKVER